MITTHIQKKDFLLVPVWLTLLRIPLALLFPFVVGSPFWALVVLGAAGLSDVLDGFLARRWHQESELGAIADGIADKIFALAVTLSLWWSGLLMLWQVLLLGSRDLGELLVVEHAYESRDEVPQSASRANQLGKITTCLQFLAIIAAILQAPGWLTSALVVVTGVVGVVAAWSYIRRVPLQP